MKLKPNLSNNIAMIVGGICIIFIGYRSWSLTNYEFHLAWIVILLGLMLVIVATIVLIKRNTLVIEIDKDGITLPEPNIFKEPKRRTIKKEDILSISKSNSVKGMIEIKTNNGEIAEVAASQYCINAFMKYCKEFNFPI